MWPRSRRCSTKTTRRVSFGSAHATVDLYPASSFHELLEHSKLVVLCCPLSAATRHLVDARALAALAGDAVLVNAARGPVVDEAALYDALEREAIAAYASDVWFHYPKHYGQVTLPWSDTHDLNQLPPERTVLSPHRGGAVGLPETERRRYAAVAAALNAVAKTGDFRALATGAISTLDPDAGY